MTLLYIILSLAGLALFAFLAMVIVSFFKLNGKLSKGEISPDELEKLRLKKVKRTKGKGGFSFLSYPSPLNNWGLWN